MLLPPLPTIDLTLLSIRRRADAEASTNGGGGGAGSASGGMLGATCGPPTVLFSMSAADGASAGFGAKIFHAWSQMRGLLAVANARNEILVLQVLPPP